MPIDAIRAEPSGLSRGMKGRDVVYSTKISKHIECIPRVLIYTPSSCNTDVDRIWWVQMFTTQRSREDACGLPFYTKNAEAVKQLGECYILLKCR